MAAKSLIFDLIASDHASKVFERVGVAAESSAAEVEASQRKIAGAHTKSTGAANTFAKAASKAFVGAAAAAGVFAVVSTKMAGDFQKQMVLLQTGAGESAGNLKMVSDGILRLAGQTGTSAKDLASAMYLIESAGNHGAKGLEVLKAAAQGAKADGADLNVVADALTTTLTDLGPAAVKGLGGTAAIMSKMVVAVSLGKMRMDDYAGSIHNVLPNATALWQKTDRGATAAQAASAAFAQVSGALATMTAEGISADQASQNLNHAIVKLANPTLAQTKAMASYGLQAADISANLGKRGLTGTLELIESTILRRMGPAGLTLRNAFNTSQAAAKDATREFNNLPPAAKALAQAYAAGTLSLGDYRSELKKLPAVQANLVTQWKSTQDAAHGFAAQLRSGGQDAQTFTGAVQSVFGDMTGLQVALHLGGEHAATFNANVAKISKATSDAKGNVKDWTEVQKTFNQTMDRAKEGFDAWMTSVGTKLLPIGAKFVNFLSSSAILLDRHGKLIGQILLPLATFGATVFTITKAIELWRAAQLLLDAALTANPIGLVIVALGLLVTGFVEAYTHSKTFRDIVNGALKDVGDAAHYMWFNVVGPALRFMTKGFLDWAGTIIHAAATALGFIPGIGPKLRKAATEFDAFQKSVNAALNKITTHKKVTLALDSKQFSAATRQIFGGALTTGSATPPLLKPHGGSQQGPSSTTGTPGFAGGGYTGDVGHRQPAGIVHGREFVFDEESTRKATPARLYALMRSLRGYSGGGLVIDVTGAKAAEAGISSSVSVINAGLSAYVAALGGKLSQQLTASVAKQFASSSGALGAMPGGSGASLGHGLFRVVRGGRLVQGIHDVSTGFPAIDIGVPVGTPVYAGAAGTVEKSYDIQGFEPRRVGPQDGYRSYGRVIEILSNGFATLYAHLSQRGVPVGAHVSGGQAIGLSGNTGNTTGPHLHFGAQGISPTMFYDTGGKLKPGLTLAHNKSGKPEAILTSKQWFTIQGLLDELMSGKNVMRTYSGDLAGVIGRALSGAGEARALAALRRQDQEWLTYNANHTKIVKQVAAQQKLLAGTVAAKNSYAAQITSNLSGTGDLTNAFSHPTADGATAGNVKGYLQAQWTTLVNFGNNIGRLRKLGLSSGLIGQLATAGPDSAGMVVNTLAHASKADVAAVNAMEAKITAVSKNVGTISADAVYGNSINHQNHVLNLLATQEKRQADLMSHLAKDMARETVSALRKGGVRIHVSV